MNNLPPPDKIFTYQEANNLGCFPTSMDKILESYPYPPLNGIKYSYFAHYKLDHKFLNPVFLEILSMGGMEIYHCEVFFRPGTGELYDAFIHTDGHELAPCVAKINWVVSDPGNLMSWYLPKAEVNQSNELITKAGTKYLVFEDSQVDLLDQVDMQGLYVVNAGIPHGVKMLSGSSDNPRVAVSIVPRIKGEKISMGGIDVYLRLLYGASKLNLIDKEIFNREIIRLNQQSNQS
jgi:hypothetical protein